MTWLLAILGFGKRLWGGFLDLLGCFLGWLGKDFRHIVITALAVLVLVFWWRMDSLAADRDEIATDRDKWKVAALDWRDATHAWQRAHAQLRGDVAQARIDAAEADRANAARVAAEIEQIRERTADDYENRLADSAAALERLRGQLSGQPRDTATTAASGSGGRTEVLPAGYTARCQAFGAASCDALLAALPGQLAAAEDNTSKLISLQDYVRGLIAVDFSGAEIAPANSNEPTASAGANP